MILVRENLEPVLKKNPLYLTQPHGILPETRHHATLRSRASTPHVDVILSPAGCFNLRSFSLICNIVGHDHLWYRTPTNTEILHRFWPDTIDPPS
jgi:hypothetical protein